MGTDSIDGKVALFDLDGTLADFDGAMREGMKMLASEEELANDTYYPAEREGEPMHILHRRRLIKRQPGFWAKLKPLPTGMALLHQALKAGYKVSILTKGPRTNFPAWTEKVQWCHELLPMDQGIQTMIVENKGLVYGKILVDDWPPYIESWLWHRPRGFVFMPDHPWNKRFSHPQVVRVLNTKEDIERVCNMSFFKVPE